jgi:hypothetical protein
LEGYWQSLRNQWLFRLFAALKSGLLGRKFIPHGTTLSAIAIAVAFGLIVFLTV